MIEMLRAHGVTPVFVFDGAPLPAKHKENEARNRFVAGPQRPQVAA